MKSGANLRQVAARAGVSPTTAGLALRGKGRMSAECREKVLQIARQMHYRVDPIISAGMSQMRRRPEGRLDSVLAWIDATPERRSLEQNPIFNLVWNGAKRQAADLGYDLHRFWLNEPDTSPSRLKTILQARGIEGVVVLQYYQEAKHASIPPVAFDFSGLSCVSVTTRLSGPDIPFAQADHFACTELALQHLRALGYKRIGLGCPPSVDALTQHRVFGAYEGFMSHYPDLDRIPIFRDETPNEKAAFLSWLDTHKPEVFLGWKPPHEIRDMGFKVPQDIGVCLLDHLATLKDCAGVHQNHSEIGAAAVRLLHSQLAQGLRGVPSIATAIMIEGQWIPGPSVQKQGPAKRRRKAA